MAGPRRSRRPSGSGTFCRVGLSVEPCESVPRSFVLLAGGADWSWRGQVRRPNKRIELTRLTRQLDRALVRAQLILGVRPHDLRCDASIQVVL